MLFLNNPLYVKIKAIKKQIYLEINKVYFNFEASSLIFLFAEKIFSEESKKLDIISKSFSWSC